jgi:hypothetical protein
MNAYTVCFNDGSHTVVCFFLFIEGPRSRCYGRTTALRLIVQPCDEDDAVFFCFSILMEHRWNEIDRGKTEVLGEKPVPVPQIPHG